MNAEQTWIDIGKRVSRALVIGALSVTAAGCGKSYSYKYRLTVTVREGAKSVTASNVVRVTETSAGKHGSLRPKLCGSAVVLPLSRGRVLFATLEGPRWNGPDTTIAKWWGSPTRILLVGYKMPTEWPARDDSGIRDLPGKRGVITLEAQQLPDILTFKNISDPTSVVALHPDDLSSDLGPGVSLISAKLEPTGESVTPSSVKTYLPWFNSRLDYLDGSSMGRAVKGYLSNQLERCD